MEHSVEIADDTSVYLCNLLSDSYCNVECETVDSLCVDDLCTDFVNSESSDIINDIDLYLECSDDVNYTVPCPSPFLPEVQTAIVAKNVNFRVSFPNVQEENPLPLPSWECLICGNCMKKESLKNKHLRDIHGIEKPFCCKLCKYCAACQKLLTRHYKRKHKLCDISPESIDNHKSTVLCKMSNEKSHSLICKSKQEHSIDPPLFSNPSNIQKKIDGPSVKSEGIRKQSEEISHPKKELNVCLQGSVSSIVRKNNFIIDFETRKQCSPEALQTPLSQIVQKSDTKEAQSSSCIVDIVNNDKQGSCVTKTNLIEITNTNTTKADINNKECAESNIKCNFCHYIGSTKKLLKAHIQTMHNPNRIEYECKICHYRCKQKKYFDGHTKKHQGELDYCCRICTKKFVSHRALKRHNISHSEQRNYLCTDIFCKKVFKTFPALTDHRRNVHNCINGSARRTQREKRLKCSEDGCDRWFRDNHGLKIHLCCHRDERPLKCGICNYRCIQKSSMNWHKNAKHHTLD